MYAYCIYNHICMIVNNIVYKTYINMDICIYMYHQACINNHQQYEKQNKTGAAVSCHLMTDVGHSTKTNLY